MRLMLFTLLLMLLGRSLAPNKVDAQDQVAITALHARLKELNEFEAEMHAEEVKRANEKKAITK